MTRDQKRAVDDGKWWQSMLPPGWQLHGWTYRSSACAFTPDRNRLVELDAELLTALRAERL